MKYSTGKRARMRHSTAREWDEMEKEKKRQNNKETKNTEEEKNRNKSLSKMVIGY